LSPENITKNMALLNLVKKWAVQKQVTPAQISLAWLMAQKAWIVPIPGTTQMAHMLENTGAAQVHFTAGELSTFNTELAAVKIEGVRLPEFVLAFSGVEAPAKK
ncbi:MAG: aldo/keto reductase, partial [Sphingobacteriaceae bacterium]